MTVDALEAEIADLVAEVAPQLLAEPGFGPLTAGKLIGEIAGAQRFASDAKLARAGAIAPIPVSSGNTNRHRLDRGGNRQINTAIHRVAITRLRCHPETKAYIARKRTEGKTNTEAIRCLKRHLARRIWHLLQPPPPDPQHQSLDIGDAEAAARLRLDRTTTRVSSRMEASTRLSATPHLSSRRKRGAGCWAATNPWDAAAGQFRQLLTRGGTPHRRAHRDGGRSASGAKPVSDEDGGSAQPPPPHPPTPRRASASSAAARRAAVSWLSRSRRSSRSARRSAAAASRSARGSRHSRMTSAGER